MQHLTDGHFHFRINKIMLDVLMQYEAQSAPTSYKAFSYVAVATTE